MTREAPKKANGGSLNSRHPQATPFPENIASVKHSASSAEGANFLTLPEPLSPLREYPNWLVWRYEPNPKGGKPYKVPYQAPRPRVHANVSDKRTWASYAEACDAFHRGRPL